MRNRFVFVCFVLFTLPYLNAREPKKGEQVSPSQFVIGRDTFFDFGPPFHYLEVISVEPAQNGTHISRILVTPPGDACTQPAHVECNTALVSKSIGDLLTGTNPCMIPESELRKEQKRCKHCLVFSGADVTMRVQCGEHQRQIRMDILDRDIYDPSHAKTPERTSWTMALLSRLDQALGPGPMEKPIFTISGTPTTPLPKSKLLDELSLGSFNSLFQRTTIKVSDLYRQALHPPPSPWVELVSSDPTAPTSYDLPAYSPLARAAHISGRVQFTAQVDADGHLSDLKIISGHPLLTKSVEESAQRWIYPPTASGSRIAAAVEFKMNCTTRAKP